MREDFTPAVWPGPIEPVMLKRFFGLFQTKDGILGQNNYFVVVCCIVLYSTVH